LGVQVKTAEMDDTFMGRKEFRCDTLKEGKKPLERRRRRCEKYIDLKEVEGEGCGLDLYGLGRGCCEHGYSVWYCIKRGEFLD
jgi:hypothetical protein